MPSLKHDLTFFSEADRRLSLALSEEEFDTHLMHSLLLEPGLVLPDVFFFISPHVARHASPKPSLFELALKKGFIVPVLRGRVRTFEEVAEHLRAQQIYGLLDKQTVNKLAYLFDLYKPPDFGEHVWPDKMGESYLKVLDVLLRDEPPRVGDSQVDENLWHSGRDLRQYSITAARERELTRSGFGVRRGEIVNFAGRRLGVVASDEGIGDAHAVLERYRRQPGDIPYVAVSSFFDWLDELYRHNQAVRLGVRSSFFERRPGDLALLAPATELPTGSPANMVAKSSHDELDVVVEIPTAAALMRLDAERLLDLKTLGTNWYQKAYEFMGSSERERSSARKAAIDALLQYASSLRQEVHRHQLGKSPVEELSVKTVVSKGGPAAISAVLTAVSAEFHSPEAAAYAVLVQLARAGYITYKYLALKHRWRERKDQVRVSRTIRLPSETI